MSEPASDFTSIFLAHLASGQKLFHSFNPTNDPTENKDLNVKAAIAICSDATHLLRAASEVKALTEIFAALDEAGRSAILPIIEARLSGISSETSPFLSEEDYSTEATATECQQFQANIRRFFEALNNAHSLALLAGANEQLRKEG